MINKTPTNSLKLFLIFFIFVGIIGGVVGETQKFYDLYSQTDKLGQVYGIITYKDGTIQKIVRVPNQNGGYDIHIAKNDYVLRSEFSAISTGKGLDTLITLTEKNPNVEKIEYNFATITTEKADMKTVNLEQLKSLSKTEKIVTTYSSQTIKNNPDSTRINYLNEDLDTPNSCYDGSTDTGECERQMAELAARSISPEMPQDKITRKPKENPLTSLKTDEQTPPITLICNANTIIFNNCYVNTIDNKQYEKTNCGTLTSCYCNENNCFDSSSGSPINKKGEIRFDATSVTPQSFYSLDVENQEIIDWRLATTGNNQVSYQIYLDKHPEGVFASLAKNRLKNDGSQTFSIGTNEDKKSCTMETLDGSCAGANTPISNEKSTPSSSPTISNSGEYTLSCNSNSCSLNAKGSNYGVSTPINKNSVIKEILNNPNIKSINWDNSVKFEEELRTAFSIYRGEENTAEKLSAHLKAGYPIDTTQGIYINLKTGDWNEINSKLIQTYLQNNQPLSSDATMKIQTWYGETYTNYQTLIEKKNKGTLDEEDKKDLSKIEIEMKEKGLIIQSLDSEKLFQLYSEMDQTQFNTIVNSNNECKNSIWNLYCVLHTTITKDTLLNKKYLESIQNVDKSDFEKYKSGVNSITLNTIKGVFEDNDPADECNPNTGGTIEKCRTIITDPTFCEDDIGCKENVASALKILKLGEQNTPVETNIGYDILTTILSPDQNAMSAAKLFGVEADYSNVPKFLSESIPSQICLAKIDGYLDKTKESSINGQGGLTSYGCSEEYTQVYDEETKKYKKMPQTQCLEVLADLRAQRTQMTPDGKTAISYSYYIKAPPSTELKYIVAISYVESGTIKKQTIVPLTKTSGIKNGFDSVELFLNASENGEINENSFTINLLAIYENNEVYQKLSYSIPPITTGDSYSAPIPAQVANSNSANSGTGSNQNVKAELSTEDMLAMI